MRITRESVRGWLGAVAVPAEHEAGITSLLELVVHDPVALQRAEELAAALRRQVGRVLERGSVFGTEDGELGPGSGAVPLLALLAAHDEVDAYWRRRNFADDVRRATAGEVARQISKTARVTGQPGFTDFTWVEIVWRGGFAQLGRLQFELIRNRADGELLLNTHIPAGGPLSADAVAESLARAAVVMERAFLELGPLRTAVCTSWLLDPQLADLVPGSNVAAFGALWERGTSGPADDDGLYFVFDLPRGSAPRLGEIIGDLRPTSRLQAALLELWGRGGQLRRFRGTLDLTTRPATS